MKVVRSRGPEQENRRALGLCYRCDEKYSSGHKYKKKEVNILLVQEQESEEEKEQTEEETSLSLADVEVGQKVQVHLNSVVGLSNPKTMKMEGVIGEQEVVILVDSGATHNFISREVVEKLKLTVEATKDITMGMGNIIKGGVTLLVQGLEIREEFLPVQLGNSDVIMGVQWLETLGSTYTNWKLQVMKFSVNGVSFTLRGDPSLGRSMVSLKAMGKMLQQEGHCVLVELGLFETASKEEGE